MSLLRQAPQVLDAEKRVRRDVALLDEDLILELPEVVFTIRYVDAKRADALAKSFRDRDGNMKLTKDADLARYKKTYLKDVVSDWKEVTGNNLKRMCPVFMEADEALSSIDNHDEEIDFDVDNLEEIAEYIDNELFTKVVLDSQKLAEYAREKIEAAKKSSRVSSNSTGRETRQSNVPVRGQKSS